MSVKSIFRTVLITISVSLVFLSVLFSTVFADNVKSVFIPNFRTKQKIIIDAGHGGFDGGAVAKNGTQEKDINLAISLLVEKVFTALDYDVIMIRETDKGLEEPLDRSIHDKKVSDIKNRVKIADDNADALYISIHANKFGQTQYSGLQTFYSKNSGSQELAALIQNNVKEKLTPENNRKIKPIPKDIYIMNKISNTAVLVECGFISNETELSLLCNETYQKSLALVIALSIDQYITDTNKKQ